MKDARYKLIESEHVLAVARSKRRQGNDLDRLEAEMEGLTRLLEAMLARMGPAKMLELYEDLHGSRNHYDNWFPEVEFVAEKS